MADDGSARHLISLDDLTDGAVRDIVERGATIARRAATATGATGSGLAGTVVGIYFRRTSTRTRTAFTSGALRLGAGVIAYGPGDLQLNTGESSEDTGRVLSGMLDVLVARTADDPAEMRVWAGQRRMAVVNAMSADEHPTQALADLTTLTLRFGSVEGLRVLYLGEGNNTAAALAGGSAATRERGWSCAPRRGTASRPRSTGARRPRRRAARWSASGTTWPTCRGTSTWSTPPAGRPPEPASPTPTGARCSRRSG
ncbi:hypothetical protein GCM10027605_29710 [Micromonospora zhanjiangensis]